ncbi:hypothetical protein FEAC_26890 [Ferrimicrobium acidiphilum DSM 19497]|uniref:Uncharacterized protein n=1 Tax=Ferrimicrobium acidiphilum DSM 19497 TaxID=1121877 RepID=A0A0D8FQJ3_9ACTN|nr:hypothetical protein FEAC_26890 [Ferrimicrobium acidiphilum DSM 19497]
MTRYEPFVTALDLGCSANNIGRVEISTHRMGELFTEINWSSLPPVARDYGRFRGEPLQNTYTFICTSFVFALQPPLRVLPYPQGQN